MTNLKLLALGRSRTAKFCHIVGITGLVTTFLAGKMGVTLELVARYWYGGDRRGSSQQTAGDIVVCLAMLSLLCCFVTLVTQCCSLLIVACRGLRAAGEDEAVRSTALFLLGNAQFW